MSYMPYMVQKKRRSRTVFSCSLIYRNHQLKTHPVDIFKTNRRVFGEHLPDPRQEDIEASAEKVIVAPPDGHQDLLPFYHLVLSFQEIFQHFRLAMSELLYLLIVRKGKLGIAKFVFSTREHVVGDLGIGDGIPP